MSKKRERQSKHAHAGRDADHQGDAVKRGGPKESQSPRAKRKVTKRTVPKKPPAIAEGPVEQGKSKRLVPFWSYDAAPATPRYTPREGTPYWTEGIKIGGVEVPEGLHKEITDHGGEIYEDIVHTVDFEPWRFFDHFPTGSGDRYTSRCVGRDPADPASWEMADLGDPSSWRRNDRSGWRDHIDFSYAELMVLHAAINTAMANGFLIALLRYADQLKAVPELAKWHKERDEAGDRGRETATRRKHERFQRIRDMWAAMEAAGLKPTSHSVAAAIDCSPSTVNRAFKPEPTKRTKR
jgi:hypothetical protein